MEKYEGVEKRPEECGESLGSNKQIEDNEKLKHTEKVGAVYDLRASEYDKSFHVELANDFVKWAEPEQGCSWLDLAAGTGLITLPAKRQVGEEGMVVGIDVSEGMQVVAKQKCHAEGLNIAWLLGDIGDLRDSSALRGKIMGYAPARGFDIITCCAALILVNDPAAAISYWAEMLAPGGLMLIDVPHPNCQFVPETLYRLADEEYISSWLLHGLNHRLPSESRLRKWCEDAKLTVETWSTRSYTERTMNLSDPNNLWETVAKSPSWNVKIKPGVNEEDAKKRFAELLSQVNPGSQTVTEHAQLIVVRARKP